jgi:hypothetical protein
MICRNCNAEIMSGFGGKETERKPYVIDILALGRRFLEKVHGEEHYTVLSLCDRIFLGPMLIVHDTSARCLCKTG